MDFFTRDFFEFEVGITDLRDGRKEDLIRRPINFALRRAFEQRGCEVLACTTYTTQADIRIRWKEKLNEQAYIIRERYLEIDLSQDVRRFVARFDNGQAVSPGKFVGRIIYVED